MKEGGPQNEREQEPFGTTRRQLLAAGLAVAVARMLRISDAEASDRFTPVTDMYMQAGRELPGLFNEFRIEIQKQKPNRKKIQDILTRRNKQLAQLDLVVLPELLHEYYKPDEERGILEKAIGLGSRNTDIIKDYFAPLEKEAGQKLTVDMIKSSMEFKKMGDRIFYTDVWFSLKPERKKDR